MFDLTTKQAHYLTDGYGAMSITDKYILHKDGEFLRNLNLKIVNWDGSLVDTLAGGYYGELSYDNSSVVYVYEQYH
jgi:hypothetical protein